MNAGAIDNLLQQKLSMNGQLVPARVQAALALLERTRDHPTLELEKHLSEAGQSLISHETLGDKAHSRLAIEKINKNHGRRSSSIRDWGQELLDLLRTEGFETLGARARGTLINAMQKRLGESLKGIIDLEPIAVRIKGRTAEATVADVLKQAEAKGRIAEVAQYLVGAKLQLRFPKKLIRLYGSNKGDRKFRGDQQQRRGDFDLGECVFEVAAGMPDAKHIEQIASVLEDADTEMWLIVRADRQQSWKDEATRADLDPQRVVIASIELFVGQNIAELGDLTAQGKTEQLSELFRLYNETWIAEVGSPGIRIVMK